MDSKSDVESVVSSRGGRRMQLGGPRWKTDIHEGLSVLRARVRVFAVIPLSIPSPLIGA
jgi:hypothetical protein